MTAEELNGRFGRMELLAGAAMMARMRGLRVALFGKMCFLFALH